MCLLPLQHHPHPVWIAAGGREGRRLELGGEEGRGGVFSFEEKFFFLFPSVPVGGGEVPPIHLPGVGLLPKGAAGWGDPLLL